MSFKEILYQLDDFTQIVLVIFGLMIIIQLVYYLLVYLRVVIRKDIFDNTLNNEFPPVSVIICSRNEEENLRQNLIPVLEQDYPVYEVIVVNNCSEDDTEVILAEFKQKYPHLRSTIIKKDGSFLNHNKFAATVGVKAAQYEWLLFTDADCRPESPQWIKSMSQYFIDNKSIVLGYSGYLPQKGYLNKCIRYDTCFTALQYLGFAMLGKAYMGIGRNLAYRKSLFFEHNGFAAHAHIITGDDALFVNKAANKRNVAVKFNKIAHTRATAKTTLKKWIWQNDRHTTLSKYYKPGQVFLLTLEPFSRLTAWTSFIILMIICPLWQYILLMFLLRMIVFISVIGLALKKFNEPGLLKHSVLFDFFMPFVHFYIFLLNRISSNNSKWK